MINENENPSLCDHEKGLEYFSSWYDHDNSDIETKPVYLSSKRPPPYKKKAKKSSQRRLLGHVESRQFIVL